MPSTALLMLEAGANINKALTLYERFQFRKQLYAYGGPSRIFNTYRGQPPLHTASHYGSLKTMQFLLDYGADIEQRDRYGGTALFNCDPTNLDALTILCNNGAKVTPGILEHITSSGNEQTMQFFLDWFAYTPTELLQMRLMELAAQHGNVSTARALVNHGVSTTLNRQGYNSPPLVAVEYHHVEMLQFLLENADATTRTLESSMIHCAVQQKLYTAIPILVHFGADINGNGTMGFPPLTLASRFSDLDAMSWLFANGAEVDARDEKGQTALFDASWLDNRSVVEELLWRGARLDATDNEGRTAIDVAEEFEQEDILKIFEEIKAACGRGEPR